MVLPRLTSLLRNLLNRQREERELDEEVRAHELLLADEKIRAGMNPREAQRQARLELGGVEQVKEQVREIRAGHLLETVFQDVRFGTRMLRKNPGFTGVAVVTLALAIGANTAIFGLTNAVMLRPLPVQKPEELVQLLWHGYGMTNSHFSYPTFEQLRDRNHVFSGVAAVFWLDEALLDAQVGGESLNLTGQLVSGNFFSLLDLQPAAGRLIVPDDDHVAGGSQVAILSYACWKQRFGANPTVLGKNVLLHGKPFTIAGVAPQEFLGVLAGAQPDLYVPFATEPVFHDGKTWLDKAPYHWLMILARLHRGTPLRQAQAEMEAIYAQVLTANVKPGWPQKDRDAFLARRLELTTAANGFSDTRREYSRSLLLLSSMVGLVLVIACANVASMFLARGVTRQRELAVRRALGAGRGRLIRQLLTECLLLGAIGGTLGFFLSSWLSSLLVYLVSSGPGHIHVDPRPDARVLGFTVLACLLSVALFGLLPAWRVSGLGLASALKEGSRAFTCPIRGLRLGRSLVVFQVTFSVLLMFLAALFVQTLRNLEIADPGFQREKVLLFSVNPASGGYKGDQVTQLYRDALERLRSLPALRSASFSEITPIWGGGNDADIRVEGYTPRPNEDVLVNWNTVSPEFFSTLGTPLVLGRDFGPQDTPASPKVAIINRAMARYFFGDRNPIGKKFGMEGSNKSEFEIVGVVGDAKYLNLREEPPRTFYLDGLQGSLGSISFEVRTAAEPVSEVKAIRAALRPILGNAQLSGFKSLEEQVDASLHHERLVAALSSLFGWLALLLTSVGLYGITAYAVEQRTNEIGIRIALGAERGQVQRMVLGETIRLVGIGLLAGIPCAMAAGRLTSSILFGLKFYDPVAISTSILLMVVVAIMAGYVPASRAMRVDPIVALRYE